MQRISQSSYTKERNVRLDNYSACRKRRVREFAREVRKNGLEENEDNKAAFPVANLGHDTRTVSFL